MKSPFTRSATFTRGLEGCLEINNPEFTLFSWIYAENTTFTLFYAFISFIHPRVGSI